MATGIVTRNLVTGEVRATTGHAVVLASGGYGNVFFRSTLAKNSNATATWRAHLRGALFASPSFIQFHPTALPVNSEWQSKTILMSESLRNDGRIWVPKKAGDDRNPNDIPEDERDYYLERLYPAFGNLSPRDVSSRAARTQIESGHGVGPLKNSVYLDFRDALARLGQDHDHRALRQPVRDVPRRHRRGSLHRCRCGSHLVRTSRWADCGATSTR